MRPAFHGSSVLRASALAAIAAVACVRAGAATSPAFVSEPLAENVFLLRPRVPSIERTNSLLALREDGPLVIDAQPTAAGARELLAAVAALDSRPVRFLLLSHPHVESVGGASAFPETTVVIASGGCRRALEDKAFDPGAELRAAAPSPEKWVAPALRLPVVVPDGPMTLADGRVPVTVYPIGQAHSAGDMIAQLPHGIVYVGALVSMDSNPYASDGDLTGWIVALNQLARMNAEILVPLRGPRGTAADLSHFRDGMAWVRGQVEAGLREGVPWEGIPDFVEQSHRFAEFYGQAASPSFHRLLVEKVLREADEERTKRTLPSIAPH
jgi:glyoxylase-like metal-dependent hydrolase (beta-lactamase superfamily II)